MIDDVRQRLRKLEDAVRTLTEKPVVLFKKLHEDAVIPEYKSAEAAGMDLIAVEDCILIGTRVVEAFGTMDTLNAKATLVSTGLAIELPPGYEAQVRPRSGLALKGITVINSPGTIDSDYRGEVKVALITHGNAHRITKGDRIAQLVICRVAQAGIVDVGDEQLSSTDRGPGGFGSTGK